MLYSYSPPPHITPRIGVLIPPGKNKKLFHGLIDFDKTTFRRFKRAYNACTADQFTFDGHAFLKAYAKYLIEYLEGQLK